MRCGRPGTEAVLLDKVRRAGCRLIGPNCMGLLNTDPAVQDERDVLAGVSAARAVAMSTQSGALGLAILDYAKRLDIGISSFVSVGNKADVSGNDLIQYWAEDPSTSVILLYLESFGNPKKFSEIARRVGRTKPIVAVKSGRSSAGSRAAASHTGALASNDVVVDALFRQAGVIRTERLEEMFDVAALLSHQPVPRGARVAILTNAGGPGILAADACEANGLELPPLERGDAGRAALVSPRRRQRQQSRRHAGVGAAGSLPPRARGDAARRVGRQRHHDLHSAARDGAGRGGEAHRGCGRRHRDKPVLGVFMRSEGAPAALAPIPSYAFPESAALALARVTAYGQWRSKPIVPAPALERFDPTRSGDWSNASWIAVRGGRCQTRRRRCSRPPGIASAGRELTSDVDAAAAAAQNRLPRRPQGARAHAASQDRAQGRLLGPQRRRPACGRPMPISRRVSAGK